METMTHACGGTILVGGAGEQRHTYCARCKAFAYGAADVPDGTDEAANRRAWDDGEGRSPTREGAGLYIFAPATPGATPKRYGPFATREAADTFAGAEFGERADLGHQDVRIVLGGKATGQRIAYAGPCR